MSWPIPYMCLVPSAGPEPLVWSLLTVTVTAMTEPRGVAKRGLRSLLEVQPFQTAVRQVGNSGVRALTLVSIYVFALIPWSDTIITKRFATRKGDNHVDH